ncbi:transposase family protein [Streptomyces sp. NPDC093594]|uniref:helix-turn-helix domain-containing protein n=1 Tax=Streptomyces sp. NPDC093594 TaxID=3155305 RepID=UPI00344F80A3
MGGGAKYRRVFVDRLLATLIHLRHGATHDVLACWFGVNRSTITRAINEVRPPCLSSDGAPSAPTCGCRPWPKSLTTSARAGRPASSTALRSESAGRQPGARTGAGSSPARTSRMPLSP